MKLSGAQLLGEPILGVFWHFHGGKSSTKVFYARLFVIK
jgi:hypothetical protein